MLFFTSYLLFKGLRNNTNFKPPPEPLYCKLCEPDDKNQQVHFEKNVTAICVIVALMIIIISN